MILADTEGSSTRKRIQFNYTKYSVMNLGTNKVVFCDKLGIHQLEITEEEKDPVMPLGHGVTMN